MVTVVLSSSEPAATSPASAHSLELGLLGERLSAAVLGSVSFDGALLEVMRIVCDATNWSLAQAWTRRITDEALDCSSVWHAASSGLRPFREATVAIAPLERGIPPLVAAAGAGALVVDVERDPRFLRKQAAARAGFRTGVFIPVRVGRDLVAVLEFFSPDRFDARDPRVDAATSAIERVALVIERLRLDDSLRVLHEGIQQAADALLISTVGSEGRLCYVNSALTGLFAVDAYDLLGLRTRELLSRSFGEMASNEIISCAEQGKALLAEAVISRADGKSVPCELSVRTVVNRGRVTHFVVIVRDVTDRKRREAERERLRLSVVHSVRQWRQTFDALDFPVLIVGRGGQIHRLNLRAMEMSRRSYSQNLELTVTNFLAQEPWTTAELLLRHVAEHDEGAHDQVFDVQNGRTWDICVTPLGEFPDLAGKGEDQFLLVARDITHLVELQESLRRHETMATMGEIVAGVAHEVRNPLFGMSATLDAFANRFGEPPDQAPYLKVLRTSVERMADLMRDLLAYGRPPTPQLILDSFEEVLRESIESCAALAQRSSVRLLLSTSSPLPPVLMDRARIRRALTNLFENALQHSSAGTCVTASAFVSECGTWLTCSVRDLGPGFDEADLPHVFSPFFTRRAGGTGLGLAIVHRVIDQHGGHILASNAEGGGGVLTIQFPIPRGEST